MKILNKKTYKETVKGYSAFSNDLVEIIGEQTIQYDGKIIEQYVYNIEGYKPENGKPFAALKANITIL